MYPESYNTIGRKFGNTYKNRFELNRLALLFACLIASLSYVESVRADPQVLSEAHFDSPDGKLTAPNPAYLRYQENGEAFNMPYQGQAHAPQISDSLAMDGTRSLRLSVGPSMTGQSGNDRSEFTLVHQSNPASLHLGQDRYLGFAIYFDDQNFPPPNGQIIVCQIWQAYKDTPTGPPAFITMVPKADDLSFLLATRDDDSTKSHVVRLAQSTFVRNAWNSVVLHVLPRPKNDPDGPGIIEMWLNGSYLGGSERAWGYAAPNAVDSFDVRVGLYANPGPSEHSVWVDRIRWGTTRAAVDPGLVSAKPNARMRIDGSAR